MPAHRYTKEERKRQVILALSIKAQHGETPEATAYELAKKLDITPSGAFYDILAEMVANRELNTRFQKHRPNADKVIYILTDGEGKAVKVRDKTIRINGVDYVTEGLL